MIAVTAFIDVDAIDVHPCESCLPPGWHEETATEISYSGTWTPGSGGGASGGAFTYTNDPSAEASFCFSGIELTLYYTGFSNRGEMKVCVDGSCETVDQYRTELMWQESHTVSGLGLIRETATDFAMAYS